MRLTAPRSATRSAFATTAISLLTACALGPMRVDRSASAPQLPGFGSSTMAISTGSADARRWFAQGMSQAYAFNEYEAVRAFKAGLAKDPACAMCAWGVAYQLGPNINDSDRGDRGEALRFVDLAKRHVDSLPPRDRALIEALALRYASAGGARDAAVLMAPVCSASGTGDVANPLDIAYAERMRQLADRFPDDPDVLSVYAEAEMIVTRDDHWWDPLTARPAGRIGEVARRLEAALQRHPDHVGLNHYMIHAVDALPVAARAEAAADRLGRLAPASPHLLHMPAHTYLQLGRYAEASRVNEQALAADDAQDAELGRQGFSITKDWRSHDGQFLWYAALMEGRGELALQTARASAQQARGSSEFAEFVRSRPLLTLLRLERWDALQREPVAAGDKGMAMLLGAYAHGVALARSGQPAGAVEALARLEPAAAALIAAHATNRDGDKLLRAIAQTTQSRLRAEVAASQGRLEVAIAEQARALELGRELDETEPPMLAAENRLALGDMQLQARRWADAEQTFRADLALHPKSGWALRGLGRALQAQGRGVEAQALHTALARGWHTADASLLAAK